MHIPSEIKVTPKNVYIRLIKRLEGHSFNIIVGIIKRLQERKGKC